MRGKLLTEQEKQLFLKKLKSRSGDVSKACQAIKISRSAIYEHKKTDAVFSENWDDVIASIADDAEEEAYRRAVKGVLKPIFYKGKKVASVREFSDQLLILLLKANRPEKYRERIDLNQNISGSLDVDIQAEIDRLYEDVQPDTNRLSEISMNGNTN